MRICLTLLFIPWLLFANTDALRAHLALYEGRWFGVFHLEAPDTGYDESFSVEQRYWWQDDKLRGISVARRQTGLMSSRSVTHVSEGKFISEVTRGDTVEKYFGVLKDGGIVWIPANIQRAMDYQIKEDIITVDGDRILRTRGFDTFDNNGQPAHLIYLGELVLEAEEANP